MVFENAKRLFEFFNRTGQTARANEVSDKYPELKAEVKEVKKVSKKKESAEDAS